MSASDSSYIIPQPSPSIEDDLDSLPESESTSSSGDGLELSDAEREWRESLQQLELLLTMVLVPFIGKYFGRKFAYWGWARVMEWQFPVSVVTTDTKKAKAAGLFEAAVTL